MTTDTDNMRRRILSGLAAGAALPWLSSAALAGGMYTLHWPGLPSLGVPRLTVSLLSAPDSLPARVRA